MHKIKPTISFILAFFMLTSLAACAPAATGSIVIEDAWVRSSVYSSEAGGMTGIFAKITNYSNQDVTLIGGETDAAMMVETHEVVGGLMQQKQGGIVIKARQSVALEPGGLHIMLMNLTAPIVAGDEIEFTFKFDAAGSQTYTLTAKTSVGGDEDYTGN